METSLTLLEQIRQQPDSDAWDRLAALYTPLLQAWLRRYEVFSPQDVDDLVQETLLTVSKELPEFEHNQQRGAFRKWLRLILVHRLRNFWRANQNRAEAVGGSDFLKQLQRLEDDGSELSEIWNREHDQHVMANLMTEAETQFAPHIWRAFHMQVMEEIAQPDVAKQMDMSLSAVYAAKSRVLNVLRKMAGGLV